MITVLHRGGRANDYGVSTNNLGEAQGTPLAEKIRYVAFDGFPKEGVSRESRGPLYQSRVAQIV